MVDWIPLDECWRLPAMPGLYIVRHKESGKEYVGKSVNVRRRMFDHRRATGNSLYLYRAIRKHGVVAFECCLYMTGAEAEITELEVLLIEERGTFNPAGYNQTIGGDGTTGYKATAEMRAAISARLTGVPLKIETKLKLRAARLANNPFKGQSHSPESREKISRGLRAKRYNGNAQVPMRAKKEKSGRQGSHTELSKLRLSLVKRGVARPDGFGERYLGEKNPMYGRRGSRSPVAKPVAIWAPGSMLPRIFNTNAEAAAWVGCRPASISDWCVDRYKSKEGYVACYL